MSSPKFNEINIGNKMKKVLIVDSQLAMRNVLEDKLTSRGYLVDVAEDGQVGLEKMNSFCPDCVITAIVLPKIDGLELIMTVRRQKINIPIIAMCSRERFGHCDYLDSAKHFGANEVMIKPFQTADLLTVLQKHCDENSSYESSINYVSLYN